ncbi:MAG TPA: DNA repair protein RadA, partial [Rugosimonospora sp.]|nr:DNA repair protein RadA [Rugosimonospora sp.]
MTSPSAKSRSGSSNGRAARAAYECDACGHRPPTWVGRCPECGEWGSIIDSTGGAGL